jgi:hypothetical protein
LHATCLEILFAAFVIGLSISLKRLSLPRLLCCIAFCHLALTAVRNMPLAVIILLPAIAQLLSKTSFTSPLIEAPTEDASQTLSGDLLPAVWWTKLGQRWSRLGSGIDDMEWLCKMHLLPILAVIFLSITAIMGGKILGTDILASGFDAKNKPTATLEFLKKQETAGTLKENKGLNLDNWGGYINYKIGTRVFIDDRADFYGERYYLHYSILSQVLPGWRDLLKKDDFQWVLFPKDSRLAQVLMAEAGWKVAAQDPASYLLVRPDINVSNPELIR